MAENDTTKTDIEALFLSALKRKELAENEFHDANVGLIAAQRMWECEARERHLYRNHPGGMGRLECLFCRHVRDKLN